MPLIALLPAKAAEPAKPNIFLIVADDIGYLDAGCSGSR
jgi:hypothetical protein